MNICFALLCKINEREDRLFGLGHPMWVSEL